jgi:2-hydroxy-6-oxonona-2,4-dienedioate hydrolase
MDEQRYRDAEARLWDAVGAGPTEHRLRLPRNEVTVRVQEVGEGPPVLFLHGGPGASGSAWATLAARLTDHRCLLLDRPGTGLSDPSPLADPAAVRAEAETLVVDVLDALDLERAHLVGSSHGSYVALLSAARHPDRVGHSVHLGSPGFLEGMTLRLTDRLILLPGAARLFSKAKPSEKGLAKVLRQLGHGPTLDAGGIPPALLDWFLALQRHTDTMANEFASMAAMGTFRRGFDPSLTVDRATLGAIGSDTVFLWGTNEVYGDAEVAQRTVDAMPNASLEMLPDAGHLCWLDDPDHAAAVIRSHLLSAGRSPAHARRS